MRILFFTDEKFPARYEFATSSLRHKNVASLKDSGPSTEEAERYLEFVRVTGYPSRPERRDSVVLTPWPEYHLVDIRKSGKRRGMRPLPDPPYLTRHCYYVTVLPGANRFLCDETYPEMLAAGWEELGDEEREEIARSYWEGFFHSQYTLLVEGPLRIEEPCRDFYP